MKILKLTAENFKKLSAVEITPEGNMIVISGKNGAGKSSVLDAIEAALCGGRTLPKQPIKTGEVRAKVEVDMGAYKVTRKFFGANSTLTVETTGETKTTVRKPQAFLDEVVGNLSFDPLAFLNKQPAEQRNTLMDFLGLNLEEFTDKIATLKAQRSDVRKNKERKLHEAESLAFTPNLPPQEVSSESLLAELKTIQDHNETCQTIGTKNALAHQRVQLLREDVCNGQKAIQAWEQKIKEFRTKISEEERCIERHPDVPMNNSTVVEAKLKTLSATNGAIRRNEQKKAAMNEADLCVVNYQELGDVIKVVENQKAKKLAEAVMPVKGLTILADGLGYNGLPLEQECESKRLKICVAIAMAMNPKLTVLRIDGNGLDKDSLVTIGKMVGGTEYQIWIEKVSDDNKIGFYIEDGNLMPPAPFV